MTANTEVRRKVFQVPQARMPTLLGFTHALRPNPAEVWRFWHALGQELQFDSSTVIGTGFAVGQFTALPFDHGKHWCFPHRLKLSERAIAYASVAATYTQDAAHG